MTGGIELKNAEPPALKGNYQKTKKFFSAQKKIR